MVIESDWDCARWRFGGERRESIEFFGSESSELGKNFKQPLQVRPKRVCFVPRPAYQSEGIDAQNGGNPRSLLRVLDDLRQLFTPCLRNETNPLWPPLQRLLEVLPQLRAL